jgi:hypothetical protein
LDKLSAMAVRINCPRPIIYDFIAESPPSQSIFQALGIHFAKGEGHRIGVLYFSTTNGGEQVEYLGKCQLPILVQVRLLENYYDLLIAKYIR